MEYLQQFSVPFSYPVCFTQGLFDADNRTLADVLARSPEKSTPRILVYIDQGVAAAHPNLTEAVTSYLATCQDSCQLAQEPVIVPGGERTKNGWNVVQNIMTIIGQNHLCRHSYVLAIGGGSMIDMTGFSASLAHRGVRLIRVPTTTLAQGDAAVGVKNGMDEHGMKNFVGTFAPPYAVFVDTRFLETLDDRYWKGGISEAFKVAMIKDATFFTWLCDQAAALDQRDATAIEELIRRTAILHLQHIATSGDPFEFGTARPLDFGHWSAHKMEILSNYTLSHGEAVSIGIALDTCYAAAKGYISKEARDQAIEAMQRIGIPTWSPILEARDEQGASLLLQGLEEFREHLGGELTVTLPDGIGKGIEIHSMDHETILASIAHLKATQPAAS